MTNPIIIINTNPELTFSVDGETLRVNGTVTTESFEKDILPKMKEFSRVRFICCDFGESKMLLPSRLIGVTFDSCEFNKANISGETAYMYFTSCRLQGTGYMSRQGLTLDVTVAAGAPRFNNCTGDIAFTTMLSENTSSEWVKPYSFYNHYGSIVTPADVALLDIMKLIMVKGGNNFSIDGYDSFVTIPKLGRSLRTLEYNAILDEVKTGCFTGTLDEFEQAVNETYSEENLRGETDCIEHLERCKRNYISAIDILRSAREDFEHRYNQGKEIKNNRHGTTPPITLNDTIMSNYIVGVDLAQSAWAELGACVKTANPIINGRDEEEE